MPSPFAAPVLALALAALSAIAASAMCGFHLSLARTRGWGQKVRDDGPQTHLAKAGTPSMGGVAFVAAVAVGAMGMALAADNTAERLLIAGLASASLGLGFIGLLDDVAKIASGRTRGVPARWRIIGQVAVAALAVALIDAAYSAGLNFGGFSLPLGLGGAHGVWVFALRVAAVVGCANAVNFTDGVDGLAAGTVGIASAALAAIAIAAGVVPLWLTAAVVAGACAGFLLYNWHPAKLFMGDVGSMTLGGALGAVAVGLRAELLLAGLGALFVAETLSVIGQVVSFQLTGRRILKMAPLHHHLELSGWSETKIVLWAYAAQLALAIGSVAIALRAVHLS